MTPDEIKSLKPGPELDRAVAEMLFASVIITDGAGYHHMIVDLPRSRQTTRPIPAYSTTWAGLGLVVEEMERRGWYMGGGREIAPPGFPGQRMIGFGRPGPDENLGQAVSAATYMEATAKAALLALEAEKGQHP